MTLGVGNGDAEWVVKFYDLFFLLFACLCVHVLVMISEMISEVPHTWSTAIGRSPSCFLLLVSYRGCTIELDASERSKLRGIVNRY